MNILIVNDDGIRAKGIHRLAELAKKLGKVTVVAPLHQHSGMSHSISFEKEMLVRKAQIPVEGVEAYSITGTPADCTRVGIEALLEEKPDIVFSGINKGYNIGFEALYSGTIGAAIEALIYDIPAIAFSQSNFDDFSGIELYFEDIVKELMDAPIAKNEIWNVNFPNAKAEDIQGILRDRKASRTLFYHDHFEVDRLGERLFKVNEIYGRNKTADEGSDADALARNYISIGKMRSMV